MSTTLCIGLLLSGATQLRATGLPIGPGELLLLGWCVLAILLGGTGPGLQIRRDSLPYLAFWVLSLVILSIDLMLAGTFSRFTVPGAVHSFVAYLFVFLFLIALFGYGTTEFIVSSCARLVLLSAGALFVLLVAAKLGLHVGPIRPWYSNRFTGWAENPNTIAFQIAATPFLGLYLWRRSQNTMHRLLLGSAIAAVLLVGWTTFSDALTVAWMAAAAVFFILEYWWTKPDRSTSVTDIFRYFLIPAALVVLAVVFSDKIYDRLAQTSMSLYEAEGGQGQVRVLLWSNGIEAMLASPIVGLGPGGHSGVATPFSGAEAHNAFIDWGTNTGLVGLVAYFALLAWIAGATWRSRRPGLVAALVAGQVLSMFHHTLRHPVFWFYLAAIHVIALRECHARAGARAPQPDPVAEPFVATPSLAAVSPFASRRG